MPNLSALTVPPASPAVIRNSIAERPRFSTRSGEAHDLRRARLQTIDAIHVNMPITKLVRERFLENLEILDAGLEARALVITGPSGAGKTHLLKMLRSEPSLAPFKDEYGPVRPLLAIKAPSPCTLKTLAIELLYALTGIRHSATRQEHDLWMTVVSQLHAQNTSVIMIDEFHHTLLRRTSDERRNLVETLKNRLIPTPKDPLRLPADTVRPITLVLSGMHHTTAVLRQDYQLWHRSIKIPLEPLGASDSDLAKLRKFMSLIEPKLGFDQEIGLAELDMTRRLSKASNGYLGRAMHFVKGAAYRAIIRSAESIDLIEDLGGFFEDTMLLGPKRNPFLVPDIATCPKILDRDFETYTRLLGTGGPSATPSDQEEEASC